MSNMANANMLCFNILIGVIILSEHTNKKCLFIVSKKFFVQIFMKNNNLNFSYYFNI